MIKLRIELRIINPMAGTERSIIRQFDPATMNQNKWNLAFPQVQGIITELVNDSGSNPNEPQEW